MSTILIVDDDKNMVSMLERFIEPLGVSVRVAYGVDEAIVQMSKEPHPDVVLLDLILPPHHAKQTLEAVDSLKKFNPELRVIIVSGLDKDTIIDLVRAIKVDGIVEKGNGFNQTNLLRAMMGAMEGCKDLSGLLEKTGTIIADLTKKQTQPIQVSR